MKQAITFRTTVGLLALCGFLCAPLLFAQVYRWTDEDGVTHFSQTPPADNQQVEVEGLPGLDSPGDGELDGDFATDFESADVASEPFQTGASEDSSSLSPADQIRLELAESREKNRRVQAELAAQCESARARLAGIEPSRRVLYTDEHGETVRMDDEERVAEVEELHAFIDANCP